MRNKVSISIIAVLFALFAFTAHAQVRDTDISLDISPQYPAPDQSVTATLSSFSTDLDKANISWSLNGQEKSVDVGKKSLSFEMGTVGQSTTIQARIDTVDGQSLIKNIVVTPAEVDMLWQGDDAYTPPFYKGKTLVPEEGTFKVVAMPNLVTSYGRVDPENLSYAWIQDENNQPDASGWGKNYFTFKNSYLDKDNVVTVTASDISGTTSAQGTITLNTVSPEILFYRNDPKLGTDYSTTIADGYNLNNNGETFVVEPYFFEPKDITSPDLSFNWSINDTDTDTPTPKNILSIKPNPGQSGTAKIAVTITNTATLFQTLEKDITVNF